MTAVVNTILRIVNRTAVFGGGGAAPPPPPAAKSETFRYLFSAPDAADKLFIHFNDDDRVSYR